jgi:ABC-type transport system involved in cytochrome bd biosynthesis fused ATPase/permease subunit
LLKGLLGEVFTSTGFVYTSGDKEMAYCDQLPWLTNSTIKQNILGQSDLDENRYKTVVCACALDSDFAEFINGDLSLVGSNGLSLSGGQKQRVVSSFMSLSLSIFARVFLTIFIIRLWHGQSIQENIS